jgi:hypothetical protein
MSIRICSPARTSNFGKLSGISRMRVDRLRRSGLFFFQRLYVLRPKLGSLADLLIAVTLINSRHAGKRPRPIVQRQLNDMRNDAEPLQSACEAPAKIVQRPRPDCRSDLSLCAAVIAERTIRAINSIRNASFLSSVHVHHRLFGDVGSNNKKPDREEICAPFSNCSIFVNACRFSHCCLVHIAYNHFDLLCTSHDRQARQDFIGRKC